jgi:hypothetical protein
MRFVDYGNVDAARRSPLLTETCVVPNLWSLLSSFSFSLLLLLLPLEGEDGREMESWIGQSCGT